MRADLGTGRVELQLVATAFLIAYAGLLPMAGQLVDRFDRRQVFLVGLALFGFGSMACAVGIAPWLVITGRFVQGAGAAFSAPAALAIITGPLGAGPARNRALAIYGAMGAVGFSTGLVVPGILVAYAGWQASFAILVPIVALVMVATWRVPSAPSTVTGQLDGWSAGCLTLVIALGMFLVGSLGEPNPATILGLLAVLTVLVSVLVLRGGVAGLPSAVLRERRVIAAGVALAGVFAAVLSSMYVLTLALQDWRGIDGFEVGLLILPQPLLFALLSGRGPGWSPGTARLARWLSGLSRLRRVPRGWDSSAWSVVWCPSWWAWRASASACRWSSRRLRSRRRWPGYEHPARGPVRPDASGVRPRWHPDLLPVPARRHGDAPRRTPSR